MSQIVEQVAKAKQTGDGRPFVQASPYAQFLDLSFRERDGQLIGCMKFHERLVGNPMLRALHGGALGALLEFAAQFELLYRAQTTVLPKTITFTIDYLRTSRAQDTWVQAKIVRQGRRVATVHAWAWQDDEETPIVQATVKQLVVPSKDLP